MFEFSACFWILFYLSSTTTVVTGTTLQIQKIQVPTPVMSGSDVVLRCLYKDIDPMSSSIYGPGGATGPLYSLKWYKGSHEFYRHYPMEDPPTTVVSWSNFNIEADDSEPGKVVLRNVDLNADGSYTCEVSSEGTFHTDTAVANLTVIDVQNVELNLVQEPSTFEARPGDEFRWNCTFGQSRPRAHIIWLINGEPLTSSHRAVSSMAEFEEDDPEATDVVKRLQWISSLLELTLTDRHFKNQVLKVSCVAQIVSNSTFKKTAEVRIHQRPRSSTTGVQNNPSPVLGPNNRDPHQLQPSMAKIAGSQQNSGKSMHNDGSVSRGCGTSRMMGSLFLLLLLHRCSYLDDIYHLISY